MRQRVEAYTTGEETLPAFRRWFVAEVLGPIEDLTSDRASIDFAYKIGLRLFEAGDGVWTEAELKREFRRLLREFAPDAPIRAAS
jgi:hypothetical protein